MIQKSTNSTGSNAAQRTVFFFFAWMMLGLLSSGSVVHALRTTTTKPKHQRGSGEDSTGAAEPEKRNYGLLGNLIVKILEGTRSSQPKEPNMEQQPEEANPAMGLSAG